MNFADEIRYKQLEALDLKIRQQRGNDINRMRTEVFKIAAEELKIEERMSRVKTFSDKWWYLLEQLNTTRNVLIDAFRDTDEFDPGLSRRILFGKAGLA